MNISLTPELEKYVRHKVASGLYNNASEVIREALRVLLEREGAPARMFDNVPPTKTQVFRKLAALEKPLRERGLQSLAVFGSVGRGTARSDSDVDVLVEMKSGTPFSLIDLVALKDFLEDHLHRKVDVITKAGLEPDIRARVLSEAETVF